MRPVLESLHSIGVRGSSIRAPLHRLVRCPPCERTVAVLVRLLSGKKMVPRMLVWPKGGLLVLIRWPAGPPEANPWGVSHPRGCRLIASHKASPFWFVGLSFAGSTLVFAVGMSRRMMGLRRMDLPMCEPHSSDRLVLMV
jgi:hypothetical protein